MAEKCSSQSHYSHYGLYATGMSSVQITTLSSIMPGGDLIQKFYKSIVAVDSILSSFLLHIFINAVF